MKSSNKTLGGTNHDKNTQNKPVLIGKSPAIEEIRNKAKQVAKCKAPILIIGESGTGKEVLAKLIHYHSKRSENSMIAINCGAIPKDLVESKLFGHEKGAFTGAESQKKGCFELADGGTLFLDEIGEMSYSLQAKLLRAVELKSFRRIGGEEKISVDVRIISATNQILNDQIKAGNFRKDLYYRLNVIELRIPPLRHRKEDIPLLAEHFLNKFTKVYDVSQKEFSDTCMKVFMTYNWPGNVRELKNVVERSVVMSTGSVIDTDILPQQISEIKKDEKPLLDPNQDFSNYIHIPVGSSLKEVERKVILDTLSRVDNNKSEAAKILGFSRRTLHNKLDEYQK